MSRHVSVVRRINAPVAEVFAAIANSDRLDRLPGASVTVLRDGEGYRDGVGLLRRITFPGGFLLEEVVGLEPPHVFDYRIRDSFPKFVHEWGRISFTPNGAGTTVTWESTISIPAGPLTAVAERVGAAAGHVAFGAVLVEIGRRLGR